MAQQSPVTRPENPQCAVCHKQPHEFSIYVAYAEMEDMTAEDFIYQYEGTFNYRTNLFYCDKCYVKIGMPPGKAVPV